MYLFRIQYMKKIILILFIAVAGFAVGNIVFGARFGNIAPPPQEVLGTVQEGTQESMPVVPPALPVRLKIPSLGIDADIEHVGLDAENNMDVPKNDDNVAWYTLGARPGEKGSAVIAGHFDGRTGKPAVFYRVSELQPGDNIEVTSSDGIMYVYSVTAKQSFPYDDLPLQDIFGRTDITALNLITCKGTWDKAKRNYSHREVIYSRLVR